MIKKLVLALSAVAVAGALSARAESIVYDNTGPLPFVIAGWLVGPSNGNVYSVDNAFTLTSTATINEMMAGIGVPTGDTLTNVTGGIYSAPFAGGTANVFGVVAPASSTLEASDRGGWDYYQEIFDISPVTLGPGTYYLAFLAASTESGDQTTGALAQWLENGNSNPPADQWSNAGESTGLPSTVFALYGPSSNPVPEPSSLLLLGSGAVALAGVWRRRAKG